jgi:DNA-binding NarL/FixJ family response regulator
MTPIRVLLVDDEQMVAEALALRLSEIAGVIVVGRQRASEQVLAYDVASLAPDIVLIDVEPLGGSATTVLSGILDGWALGKIIVLTASRDITLAVASARGGCVGWLPKDCSLEELLTAIRGVQRGEAWFPPAILGAVLRALRSDLAAHRARTRLGDLLSRREREVLAGVAAGKSDHEIAVKLGIAVKTVRTHTTTLRAKLGVHSRRALVEAAVASGLAYAEGRGSTRPNDVVRLMHEDEPHGRTTP